MTIGQVPQPPSGLGKLTRHDIAAEISKSKNIKCATPTTLQKVSARSLKTNLLSPSLGASVPCADLKLDRCHFLRLSEKLHKPLTYLHLFVHLGTRDIHLFGSNLHISTLPPGQVGLKFELPKTQVGQ